MNPHPVSSGPREPESIDLLGTPLLVTTYADLCAQLAVWAARPGPTAVDFSNTQIVTMRRTDPGFFAITAAEDYFVPDGMPLIWCLRVLGARMPDRVYGPSFMRYALSHETELSHYFLGGSADTLEKLIAQAQKLSGGRFRLAGSHHGYLKPDDLPRVVGEIDRLSPDVVWIGMGTPKQQQWIYDYKPQIRRGVLLAVGFAFDVNAGTKRDAPMWMQRHGLTWIFRISQEPGRLFGRYLRYNTWFVLLVLLDLVRFIPKAVRRRFFP